MMTETLVLIPPGESVRLRDREVVAAGSNLEVVVHSLRADAGVGTESEGASGFGFSPDNLALITNQGPYYLPGGMYFACPSPVKMRAMNGVLIEVRGYHAMFSLGGPIEAAGRLRYIDGCTDTLLIAPPRKGDPCLNHLHFPPGIRQTMHTHPSVRCGIVARGRGRAIMPGGLERPLVPGSVWLLRPDGEHCFYTDDSSMDVIAFHPDSDCGPEDENHPMVNRTIVDGKKACDIPAIRTGEGAVLEALKHYIP